MTGQAVPIAPPLPAELDQMVAWLRGVLAAVEDVEEQATGEFWRVAPGSTQRIQTMDGMAVPITVTFDPRDAEVIVLARTCLPTQTCAVRAVLDDLEATRPGWERTQGAWAVRRVLGHLAGMYAWMPGYQEAWADLPRHAPPGSAR